VLVKIIVVQLDIWYMYYTDLLCKFEIKLNLVGIQKNWSPSQNYNTHVKKEKLEAQWAEPVSLTFHSALRKLNTEPPIDASHQVLVIWLNSYKEEDI
jgi:hypothetical protein